MFLFALVVDVVTELARDCVLSQLLYADDLVAVASYRMGCLKVKLTHVGSAA